MARYPGVPGSIGSWVNQPRRPKVGAWPSMAKLPKPQTAPTTTTTKQPAPKTTPFAFDPETDPYLQGLKAQQQTDLNTQAAMNLASKKRILLGFGSQELARKLLGDDPFVNLVSANPDTSTSTLAQTAYTYRNKVQGFNEAENAANLFYGGGRGFGLRDLAHANLVDIANQTADIEDQLSGYDENYAAAVRTAQANYWNAVMQQYGNWLQAANLR